MVLRLMDVQEPKLFDNFDLYEEATEMHVVRVGRCGSREGA